MLVWCKYKRNGVVKNGKHRKKKLVEVILVIYTYFHIYMYVKKLYSKIYLKIKIINNQDISVHFYTHFPNFIKVFFLTSDQYIQDQ